MLSVSSMALATMLGSACGTNMANMNDCNAALYNTDNCPQVIRYQSGGQDLDSLLSGMGVSAGSCGNNSLSGMRY